VLTILLFRFASPLAAVFELSICAGLITVVFISTISLADPLSYTDLKEKTKGRLKRYVALPFILIAVISAILLLPNELFSSLTASSPQIQEVRQVIWNEQETVILGQIIVLLSGVFGVVVLFKERKEDEQSKSGTN
jgi:NADH-quinone oxidoreductase subunit J